MIETPPIRRVFGCGRGFPEIAYGLALLYEESDRTARILKLFENQANWRLIEFTDHEEESMVWEVLTNQGIFGNRTTYKVVKVILRRDK